MAGKPTTITPLQKEEKSCTLMSWVITMIALVVDRVVDEVGAASSGSVSSSSEFASVAMVAGVASPDTVCARVEGPEGIGVLPFPDPRSRICSSTAGCLPMIAFPGSFFRAFL